MCYSLAPPSTIHNNITTHNPHLFGNPITASPLRNPSYPFHFLAIGGKAGRFSSYALSSSAGVCRHLW